METIEGIFHVAWPILLAILTIGIAYSKIIGNLDSSKEDRKSLHDSVDALEKDQGDNMASIKKMLFNGYGIPIYRDRASCEAITKDFKEQFEKLNDKIDTRDERIVSLLNKIILRIDTKTKILS